MNLKIFSLIIGLVYTISVYSQSLEKWIPLFNGENLKGWTVGENSATFSVENGAIKVFGPRAHLFYSGGIEEHSFKNFEFQAKVMTKSSSNSGIYIHTQYQDLGWPSKGYEVQVNNSQEDWKRTGSLYNVVNIRENYARDNVWFTLNIKVVDKRIIVKVNNMVVVDYIEPKNPKRTKSEVNRVLSSGTFALQGHDSGSEVYYKDIKVKILK